ncbi:hypothetical protein H9I48_01135 [Wolbachia pipientis]|uniref:hypothetical protein n=1 Tax=Wolbachia pipientis TaxID=955 RepID=UPI0016510DC8|nr:hypothetical protein [Wolbachia pipientis]MBC6685863.1 hypothetical protein [Wolbachia pipientis]
MPFFYLVNFLIFIAKRQPSSRCLLAAKRYRGGMMVCGGMTVKQFVIPQRDLLLAAKRYRSGMTVCGGMTVKQFVIPQRDLLLAPRWYDG